MSLQGWGDKVVQLVSQASDDDVGACEHMLLKSFKLPSLLHEHTALVSHMGPIIAVQFARLAAPLLLYNGIWNLAEVLLLDAMNISCKAADAAKAENAVTATRSPANAVKTADNDVLSVC